MRGRLIELVKPVARKLVFRGLTPRGPARTLYAALYQASWWRRELEEWVERALIATPMFLALCDKHGTGISVDRIPYLTGPCHLEVGDGVRISGQLDIQAASPEARIEIGREVFLGSGACLAAARRIVIGDYVAIGNGVFITDTEGHDRLNSHDRPAWDVPASEDGIGEVIIGDNAWIGRGAMILKGVSIGARSVIGAGAVVRASVPPDSLVMGNPGRAIPVRLVKAEPGDGGPTREASG